MNASEFFKISPKFVGKNPVLPVLECVKIENGRLTVTNLESTLFVWGDCLSWIDSRINTCVPYKVLKDLYTKCPKAQKDSFRLVHVQDVCNEQTGEYSPANQIKVEINGESVFTIDTQNIDNFPEIQSPDYTSEIELTQNELKDLKELAVKYAGKDDLRVQMKGVFFDGTNMIATDAHKMKWVKLTNLFKNAEFIVPSGTAANLIAEECVLKWYKTIGKESKVERVQNVEFKYLYQGYTVMSRTIDAKFPDYTSVIPRDNPNSITFDKAELLPVLNMAMLAANTTTNQMVLGIFTGKGVTVSTEDLDRGLSFDKELRNATVNPGTGDSMHIGLNCKTLIDILKSIEHDDIKMTYSTPNRAVIIDGNVLLMPVMMGV